ncbi:MAG: ABC transporter substrate-binding protein, partial [Nitrosopumilus sp.]
KIQIDTTHADSILYFLNNNKGERIKSETIPVVGDSTTITISEQTTKELGVGANDLKIFAISDSVLKPDFHSTSFLAIEDQSRLPTTAQDKMQLIEEEELILWILIPIIIIAIGTSVYLKKRK